MLLFFAQNTNGKDRAILLQELVRSMPVIDDDYDLRRISGYRSECGDGQAVYLVPSLEANYRYSRWKMS